MRGKSSGKGEWGTQLDTVLETGADRVSVGVSPCVMNSHEQSPVQTWTQDHWTQWRDDGAADRPAAAEQQNEEGELLRAGCTVGAVGAGGGAVGQAAQSGEEAQEAHLHQRQGQEAQAQEAGGTQTGD